MGKIDLTYINKQMAAKKAAEAKKAEVQVEVEEKEIFGETYTEFKTRLDREFDEAMAAIKAIKELGI